MPTPPAPPYGPLFGCDMECECSFPPEDLHYYPDHGWLCEGCWDELPCPVDCGLCPCGHHLKPTYQLRVPAMPVVSPIS